MSEENRTKLEEQQAEVTRAIALLRTEVHKVIDDIFDDPIAIDRVLADWYEAVVARRKEH